MKKPKPQIIESGGKHWVKSGQGRYAEVIDERLPKKEKTFRDGTVDDTVKQIFGG